MDTNSIIELCPIDQANQIHDNRELELHKKDKSIEVWKVDFENTFKIAQCKFLQKIYSTLDIAGKLLLY